MKIGIVGSGSWGTALGQVLADNGHEVMMWGRKLDQVVDVHLYHLNEEFFPGVKLNERLDATQNFEDILDSQIILLAVPTGAVEEVCIELNTHLNHPVIIINVAKGLHPTTHELLDHVIKRVIDPNKLKGVVSLIGPSHAEEVVLRKITTINAVSDNPVLAEEIQVLFSNDYFRVYTNDDVIGSQYGVAIKNVIALASGIAAGLDAGDNARAALITRGLTEMQRFGVHMGGQPETYLGLCGVGDLVVTATSIHSRNFQAGMEIGQKNSAVGFLDHNTKTVEGVFAAKVVYEIAVEEGIDMPITEQIYKIIYEEKCPSEAISELMVRDLKPERI
ncbi:glycerol-3-phosphate dehydrogenase [Erysipelothrix amsterdamensis]|uniref:Glycerol-3-phosphate dehydrogenase [NAD(P)+] n=1 Tax=Erysipelothrix amsterdamensis TaxID=2929157 RepID=A0AAU9VGV7_9FIRM|nr:glycerol-3-phosphate dehydrogenase [Erysipelothrix sp. A18Y020d]CAH2762666.1 glycerol-3-phosphate dehydrogenase [Erysipelothrix sp. A18Y020d]